ncbi:MAG: two-component sensor histidine kinase [Bacteroidetes bacterium CG02_land_8_20_14_3_00_31_25]|nr:MAG: two-component sensor histidine kinase [Bacteroidetes bacterium CG02_land_8_20_14_3_00_31_25]PIX32316.1 MAG: two-component sensor histidine kinase [Bacteroidetes bacterium CG_4_8_14_3_um_filter_31_14]
MFFINSSDIWKYLLVEILAIFIIAYVITFYTIRKILINKITPIYKIIQQTGNSNLNNIDSFDNKNLIEEASKDVTNWFKLKTREIEKLKKLEKYRREFLGNVSHELKTPIFNAQGYISTLIDGGIDDKNINKKYLEKADQSINRLITIVRDLELISKLESGELELNRENFNIVQLFKDIVDLLEMRANKLNIKVQINSGEKSIMVNADRPRISDVINNLIVNSLIYGKQNGTTTINFYDMENKILVEVSDNGVGIEEKFIPRLFERFFRVDKSRSRDQGGTGLGLAIVKHILEVHGETIHVRSTLGEGSAFSFTLNKA